MTNPIHSEIKQKTRALILEASLQLLKRRQTSSVNMADIAKAAGVSRQAVYLHFSNRAELLAATLSYIDAKLELQVSLQPAIEARTGAKKISAFIRFWADYLNEIYPVLHALMRMQHEDDAAADVLSDKLLTAKDGCRDAVSALDDDGFLDLRWSKDTATDILWMLLSVDNWSMLVIESGWSKQQYVDHITYAAKKTLIGVN